MDSNKEFENLTRFAVKTPYVYELVEGVRSIDGRIWHKDDKIWSFPTTRFWEVVDTLEQHCPNIAKAMTSSKRWEPYRKKVKELSEISKKNIEKSMKTKSNLNVPCPTHQKYLPFQVAGIEYCASKQAALNADEPGLGKTITSLGVVNYKKLTNIVVVCPNNVKINWAREARKWLVDKSIEVIVINSQSVPSEIKRSKNFFYIINYDILKKFVGEIHLFTGLEMDLVILDEVHMAKNPNALRTKYAYFLSNMAKQKLYLTGTPILNRVNEVFPIISNLRPDVWSKKAQFERKYCRFVNTGFGFKYIGGKNLDELQKSLRENVMIRRLKKDVLTELPPKRRQIIEIPTNSKYKSILKKESSVDKNLLVEVLSVNSDEEYRKAIKLRGKESFNFIDHVARVRHETALAKINDVLSFIDNLLEEKDKIVVFAHHRDVLEAIYEHYKPNSVLLFGGMSQKNKQEAVDKFQEDPNIKIFVGGIIPAGVGLTLTASDTVVFAELDWVPGNVTQAEDRCHRKGQINSVMVYHVVLEDSIDYYLASTIVKKQEEIEKTLDT